ncbi:MAG: hypothetical protein WC438_01930 [Candidatus Pacearchaeota archaeon]
MADRRLVEYFRLHRGNYPLEALKKKVLSEGYTKQDVQEALEHLDNLSKENVPTMKATIKKINAENLGDPNEIGKKPVSVNSLWMKLGGFAGILTLLFIILSSFFIDLSGISNFLPIVLVLAGGVCMLFFYFGFVTLGKKYNQKLLGVISWIFIVFTLLFIFGEISLIAAPNLINKFINLIPTTVNFADLGSVMGLLFQTLIIFTISFLVLVLIFMILTILLGVGLLKLSEHVKFAKLTGILLIIGASTLVIGIGLLILPIAYIFEIVLLLSASKKQLF